MSEKSEKQPDSGQNPVPVGEISQQPSALEDFLDANQKKLIIGGIVLIVALVAYVIIDGLALQKRKDDSAEVSAARTVPELEAQASEKDGTNAGGTALLHKARLQWEDLQQAEAIKTLESFIADYPEHPAYASGLASLASYHHNMGEIEKAKDYYTQAVDQREAVSSIALISLGDIARNEGDEDAAKSYYDRAASEYGEIHANIKALAERHAKLLGVNAPTEVTPAPPEPKTPAPPTPGAPSKPVEIKPLTDSPEQPKKPDTDGSETPDPTAPDTSSQDKPAEPNPAPEEAETPEAAETAPDNPDQPAPETTTEPKTENSEAPADPPSN